MLCSCASLQIELESLPQFDISRRTTDQDGEVSRFGSPVMLPDVEEGERSPIERED